MDNEKNTTKELMEELDRGLNKIEESLERFQKI